MRFAAGLVLVLSVACSSPSETVVAARLQACGLATEGELGVRLSVFYAPDACYRDCLVSASCEALQQTLCGASIALLQDCDARCAYACPEGGLIALEAVCDGNAQCVGGADELGCPVFTCDDGTARPLRVHCDGYENCVGGEDERGCDLFHCEGAGGWEVGPWARCNGSPECLDESDESDCPEHVCADGFAIPLRGATTARCNGYEECPDRSDEVGCAMLTPMCPMP